MDYKIEFISVNDLKPYENNAKTHPQEQIDKIASSIKRFGFQQNLVIDKNNCVVIGHGRLLAAQQLGIEKVPCIRVENLNEKQIKALRLADNKVAESAWDFAALNIELDGLVDMNMDDFGFPNVADLEDGEEEDYEVPEQFKEFDENMETNHVCPRCGYEWR